MKKINCRIIPEFWDFWNSKLVTTMRLTVFALLLGILQGYAAESYAQLTRLNLHAKNSTVKDLLNQIEEQSEFYFLYNSKLVDVERQVDVDVKNKSINDVLTHIFEGTGTAWQVIDRQIVLTPTEMSSSSWCLCQLAGVRPGGFVPRTGRAVQRSGKSRVQHGGG